MDLLQSGLIGYSEANLKRLYNSGNDAIFLLKKGVDKVFPVAIEYEHTLKSIPRYRAFFSKVYTTSALEGVYYICKTQTMLEKIMAIEKNHFGDFPTKIFYQLYDEVIKEKDSLPFTSRKKSISTLTKCH